MSTPRTTSLALSQKLKKLGVPQESAFYWSKNAKYGWQLVQEKYPKEDNEENGMTDGISAFLSDELMERLPAGCKCYKETIGNGHTFNDRYVCEIDDKTFYTDTLPEALGRLLAYLIEEKLI